jgi:hypothetical protein
MKKYVMIALLGSALSLASCSKDAEAPDGNASEEAPSNPVQEARTEVPDEAFEEQLVSLGIDNEIDGSVLNSSAALVTSLVMNGKGITNLAGISAFTKLDNLWINDNQLTTLDLSRNTGLKFVFVNNNELTNINVRTLTILEKLSVTGNSLSRLDISNNTALQTLNVKNNALTGIDLSAIPNSLQLNFFAVENNPLTCIKVNGNLLDNIPSQWTKDEEDTYALSCN